jgi:hypothetical protein
MTRSRRRRWRRWRWRRRRRRRARKEDAASVCGKAVHQQACAISERTTVRAPTFTLKPKLKTL